VSVFVSSQVWQRYPNGGGELTLALALADHSHDDGTHIWPKIKTLAKKTRQSVRTVQYQLRKMEGDGFIILVNAGNGGRNLSNEYVINPDWLKGADIAPPAKGANDDEKGATGDRKGATSGAPADNRQQSSNNRKKRAALPDDWKLPKRWGEWALADERLQKRGGWDAEHIRLTAEIFHDHWIGNGKPMKDWFATWRNWCRNPLSNPESVKANNLGWFRAYETALAKANEVGVGPPLAGESQDAWHARIRAAIDNGGKPPAPREYVPPSPTPGLTKVEPRAPVSAENRAALLDAVKRAGANRLQGENA